MRINSAVWEKLHSFSVVNLRVREVTVWLSGRLLDCSIRAKSTMFVKGASGPGGSDVSGEPCRRFQEGAPSLESKDATDDPGDSASESKDAIDDPGDSASMFSDSWS